MMNALNDSSVCNMFTVIQCEQYNVYHVTGNMGYIVIVECKEFKEFKDNNISVNLNID